MSQPAHNPSTIQPLTLSHQKEKSPENPHFLHEITKQYNHMIFIIPHILINAMKRDFLIETGRRELKTGREWGAGKGRERAGSTNNREAQGSNTRKKVFR